MATFSDNFERANGALGGNWSTAGTAPAISGGRAYGTSFGMAWNTTVDDAHRLEVTSHHLYTGSTSDWSGPMVKINGSDTNGYVARVVPVTGTPTLQILKGAYGGSSPIASQAITGSVPPYIKLSLSWDEGHLIATYQDTVTCSVDDTQYAAGQYGGFKSSVASAATDDVAIVGGSAPGLSVDPDVIGNYGSCVTVALAGVGTSWTTGTPGSPTFTVNHGTISAQEVTSETTATLTYCPGDWLGAVVFTDPSTGSTATAVVTSDPTVVPPSGTVFSQAVIDYLERSAIAQTNPTILNQEATSTGDVSGVEIRGAFGSLLLGVRSGTTPTGTNQAIADIILTMWDILNGAVEHTSEVNALDSLIALLADTADLRDRWATGNPGTEYTISEVQANLGGTPLANHQDILSAISAIPTGDNQDVLDAIAALAGDPLATVKAAIDLVYQLGTTEGYTLADVKTWAEAVQGSGLPTVKAVLDKLGSSGSTVDAQFTALSQLIVSETTIQGIIDLAVAALAGAEGATIDAVLTAISDLAGQIAPSSALTRPVWPGLDLATVGDAVALTDGLEVEGPLDGLLVHISATPSRAGRFGFGAVSSWRYVGAVIFQSDRGDWEWAQPIGLDDQVVTPASMTHAAAAKFRLEGGFAGTVRPFTVGV